MSRIPRFTCGVEVVDGRPSRCTACCTAVPMTGRDRKALSALKPWLTWERVEGQDDAWYMTQAKTSGRCPFAVAGEGCSIHDRPELPAICRLAGSVDHPKMSCLIGIEPQKKLTDEQAWSIIRAWARGENL